MNNFDTAFNYLLGDEGQKYTNDPKDSGGPTKFGITKAVYEAYYGHAAVEDDIEHMDPLTAKQIYLSEYWRPLRCEDIKSPALAIAIFDSAVLYGIGTIALLIQRSVSLCGVTLKLDGHLGDKSVDSINLLVGGGTQGTRNLTAIFCGLLHDHIDAVIVANPKDEKYRRGWTLRADRLLQLLDDNFLKQFQTMENI